MKIIDDIKEMFPEFHITYIGNKDPYYQDYCHEDYGEISFYKATNKITNKNHIFFFAHNNSNINHVIKFLQKI